MPAHKWRTLWLLALAELLGMTVWFSASAVVPALTAEWALDDTGRAWLTISTQLGFVAGSLGSALLNLPDRIPSRRLFSASALLAALATAVIPLFAQGPAVALPLRFLTGFFLAGVYPIGMKIMTTWTREDRGLGVGLLVGALTLGSASPHLVNALGGVSAWRPVMLAAAAMAALGGLVAATFVREGPYRAASPRFNARVAGDILRTRPLLLVNLGYLGHMWELYAMWSWIATFLIASFARQGIPAVWASAGAFAVIGCGAFSCVLAGKLADRLGRTTVTIASMLTSGTCALAVGLLFGGPPLAVLGLCLVWGFAVIADSAQFSAAMSELAPAQFTGTALTLQTSLGFLLTLVTIWAVPPIERLVGWQWAFAFLAIGPFLGAFAMWRLRRIPAGRGLAGGRG